MTILTEPLRGTLTTIQGLRAALGKGLGEAPPPPFTSFELDPLEAATGRGQGGGMVLTATERGVGFDYTIFASLQNAKIKCSGFASGRGMRVRSLQGDLKVISPREMGIRIVRPDDAPYDLPDMIGHTLEAHFWTGIIEHACENRECLLAHVHKARRNA